jgi:arylsulfatase A-like enzyme
VYLWILSLQSVYGTDSEPVIDILADAASILWTMVLWAAVLAALVALTTLWLPQLSVCRINEMVCRIGCILMSAVYLMRWLLQWRSLLGAGHAVPIGMIVLTAGLYYLARRRRIGSAHALAVGDHAPSWREVFAYAVLPLLFASVAVLGIRIVDAYFERKEITATPSEPTALKQAAGFSSPNIIVIVADSLRAQSLSLYSRSGVATPKVEQWGETASVYLDTHANATMTAPSLTTLLTGKHILHHGRLYRDLPAYASAQNLLQILRSHGYDTAAVTSSQEASMHALGFSSGLSQGENFAFSFLALSRLRDLGVYPTRLGGRMYQELRLLFPWLGFPERTLPYGNIDDTLERARLMVAAARQPFFLFIHIQEPHESHAMPSWSALARQLWRQLVEKKKFELEPYNHYAHSLQPEVDSYKAEYEASVRAVDAGLGQFFDELRSQPWFDDSLVILTADHGDSFERGYLYHGAELYENSTWVPLIIRFPRQQSGARVSGLTQTVDIAPTILKSAGVPIVDWMDGQALEPSSSPAQVATIALNYVHLGNRVSDALPTTKLAIWWSHFKLIAGCNNPAIELYDLANDPAEQVNLAERERDTVQRLKSRLGQQLAKQPGPLKLSCANL